MTWNQMCGPYENHYRELGEPIRETVRNAQETLCLLAFSDCCSQIREIQKRLDRNGEIIAFLTGARRDLVADMTPPRSLGELCLEVVADNLRKHGLWKRFLRRCECGTKTYYGPEHVLIPIKGRRWPEVYEWDRLALRRALYCRPENHVYPPGSSRVNPT